MVNNKIKKGKKKINPRKKVNSFFHGMKEANVNVGVDSDLGEFHMNGSGIGFTLDSAIFEEKDVRQKYVKKMKEKNKKVKKSNEELLLSEEDEEIDDDFDLTDQNY